MKLYQTIVAAGLALVNGCASHSLFSRDDVRDDCLDGFCDLTISGNAVGGGWCADTRSRRNEYYDYAELYFVLDPMEGHQNYTVKFSAMGSCDEMPSIKEGDWVTVSGTLEHGHLRARFVGPHKQVSRGKE